MVLPFLAMGAGALLSAFSSNKTTKSNEAIARANLEEQRAAREESRLDREERERVAEEARQNARLGTTDAFGNRLRFDPVKGWVTELTDTSRAIADQQLQEQILSLFRDAPQRRRAEDANEVQRGEQRGQANSFLNELNRIRRTDPETMRAMLFDRARMGIDEGYDATTREANINGLRTGNSNTGQIMAHIGKARANDLRKASLDAAIQAEDRADQRYNTQRGGVANLYTAFADRASRTPGTAYAPSNVSAATTGAIPQFAAEANKDIASLPIAATPQQAFTAPDNSMGNTLTSLGSLFAQFQQGQKSDQRYQDALDLAKRKTVGSY